MSREDLEKLLGGYATGTLTPEEQQALFEAALGDQELFNALAREQSLRDLLRDPAARVELLAALDDAPGPRWRALWGAPWARLRRPAAVAVAMAGVAGIGVFLARRNVQAPQPATVAQMRPPAPAPAAAMQAEPRPMPAPVREARPAKAKEVKAERPAPAAEAPAGGGGAASFQNARALLDAAVEQPRAPAARSGPLTSAMAVSPASKGQPGVRYSVLRKQPGGEFAEADPARELPAGEKVKLRFVSNDDGYLYVLESGPGGSRQTVAMSHMERLMPFDTPELGPGAPGEKEYYVLFTRRPQGAALLGGATGGGGPDSQPVSFVITLTYK